MATKKIIKGISIYVQRQIPWPSWPFWAYLPCKHGCSQSITSQYSKLVENVDHSFWRIGTIQVPKEFSIIYKRMYYDIYLSIANVPIALQLKRHSYVTHAQVCHIRCCTNVSPLKFWSAKDEHSTANYVAMTQKLCSHTLLLHTDWSFNHLASTYNSYHLWSLHKALLPCWFLIDWCIYLWNHWNALKMQ